ncbi:MAG TPA: inositol monophosphatase family protein [Longimicrobiales bacterium]|nr:inositol monophosphatase family protein [Longimicrobiales bacterium]
MTTEQRKGDLDFAVEVAWRAGRAALAHYQTGITAQAKPDASPVTAADLGAERIARSLIADRFPDDAIFGEEDGESGSGAHRRWIVDPIDGTRTFLRGVPLFGVMLALQEGDVVTTGVLHFPALDETVYAARGLGCWWNGRRAHVSGVDRLEDALVTTTDTANIERYGRAEGWERLRRDSGLVRTWGDCYGYALVATGRAEAMLDPVVALWDVAPLAPIIEEAGGILTDWDGGTGLGMTSAVATNAALGDAVRSRLRGDT